MFTISLRVSMTLIICKPNQQYYEELCQALVIGVSDCLTAFCKNKHQVIHLAGRVKSGLAEQLGSKDIADRTINCEVNLSAPRAQLIVTRLH